ncbi:hypothetical protein PUN28_000371 [Cardiocondyla obscurior]|uniref:Uncharacterized protein n=1 Tax=Cardiocondyla obscurior TaxID=286306 RepID=A0AAW2GZ46_9HYME
MSNLRISGNELGQHIGQDVIYVARIIKKSSDGMSAEVTSYFNERITVTFLKPLGIVPGFIEMHGTVTSESTMTCNKYLHIVTDIYWDSYPGYNTRIVIRSPVQDPFEDADRNY